MPILIDLVHGLGREARTPISLVTRSCGDSDEINHLTKGLIDSIDDAYEDGVITYVETDWSDTEDVDHGKTLGELD